MLRLPDPEDDRWCNCIAFHDFAGENVQWQKWFEFCLNFFTKHNLQPNKLGVSGGHYGHSTKYMSFKGGYTKLQKFNFEKIETLELVVTAIKGDYSSNFIIWVSIRPNWKHDKESVLVICIDEQLEPFDKEHWEEIASKLQQFTKAKYGYYYRRHLRNWPWCYPNGVQVDQCFSEEDAYYNSVYRRYSFRYDLGKYIGGLYQTGKLRDIYQLNFLSREHLGWQLASGQNLQTWINSDPSHGTLVPVNNDIWSWQIPKEQVAYVKQQLDNNDGDIIICNPTRLAQRKKEDPNLITGCLYKRLLYPIE